MLRQTPGTVRTVLPATKSAADGRTAVTMWGLLVWAYKRELVRFGGAREAGGGEGPDGVLSMGRNTRTICRMLAEGALIAGTAASAARLPVPIHADAEWVHGLVRTLDRDEYWLIVTTAEREAPPNWAPEIEAAWTRPVLRANGRPKHIVDAGGRVIACRLETGGVDPWEANRIREEARETYARWFRLLAAMRDKIIEEDALTRWRVTGIGAEPMPWLAR